MSDTPDPTPTPAAAPAAPSIDDITAAVAEAIKGQPGIDDKVQKVIGDALETAQKQAQTAIDERQAAKTEASAAMDRVAALEQQLNAARVMGAARDAGAHNPERVAQILGNVPDDKLADAMTALKESDAYLFGTPDTDTPRRATPSIDMNRTPHTAAVTDQGLSQLAEHLRGMVGPNP